jgi:uncharacterized membrane protein YfcA
MWPDVVNGLYELLGAPFIVLSIIQLAKDKKVRGISWFHVGFFTTWGFWNLFYYPHLGQWCSFAGGVAIVVANSIWLTQLIYYKKVEKCSYKKGA